MTGETSASPGTPSPYFWIMVGTSIVAVTLVGAVLLTLFGLAVCILLDPAVCPHELNISYAASMLIVTVRYTALELIIFSFSLGWIGYRVGRIPFWCIVLLVPSIIVIVGAPLRLLPGLTGKTIAPLSWSALRDPISFGVTLILCLIVGVLAWSVVKRFCLTGEKQAP